MQREPNADVLWRNQLFRKATCWRCASTNIDLYALRNHTVLFLFDAQQAELLERKAFLSESKQALLDARDSLDGRQTRGKLAHDEQSVRTRELC